MKVIVLTRGGLQDMLPTRGNKDSHRSNPHRKVMAEPAEVSSAHSTEEMANHQEGKGQTVGDG